MINISVWITSDWHFCHDKPFLYEARGFGSVEEMNEFIVYKHNITVKEDDEVFCLGDCYLGADAMEEAKRLMSMLQGKIHIICGNHDSANKQEMYKSLPNVVSVSNSEFISYRKYHFYLSHYPSLTANFTDLQALRSKTISLCGHSHVNDPLADAKQHKSLIYHCEMEAHACTPVNIETIIEEMKQFVRAGIVIT